MRHRRLVRARDLAQFRQALVGLAIGGGPFASRRRALILPTRASIEVFRQHLESTALRQDRPAVILPDLLTRDDWMTRLHQALPSAPPLLGPFERAVLMERAARAAALRSRMPALPFEIRPGLVAEMVTLYDELRRRQRSVRRFASVLFHELGVERGTDLGSEELIHQTSFLAFAFLGYERGVAASGALDEHGVRQRVLQEAARLPFDHVVVAVGDHPADPRGLWPADFDLLSRLGPVLDLDIVVTDEMHDAGFRERMEQELPGIEEVPVGPAPGGPVASTAVLIRPNTDGADDLCFTHRDREDELRAVARLIRQQAGQTAHELRESTAVVFQRPLPYLYLAQHVLIQARVPFQAFDARPLAGEPYAALLDLVLDMARTGGTRMTTVALLRSPMLRFEFDGCVVDGTDAAALDRVLTDRRVTGEADTYPREITAYFGGRPKRDRIDAARAVRAAEAATLAFSALQPFRAASAASEQIQTIAAFLRVFQQGPAASDEWGPIYHRARAAVLGVLDGLADACLRYDDRPRPPEIMTALIHHWIERQTFASGHADGGVSLIDVVASRFGEFDHVHVVGLVETEWPERSRRSIFYSAGLLKSLGWPQERDHARAQQAAFRDLLALPRRTRRLHAFQLEGDAIVAVSPLVEVARELTSVVEATSENPLIFPDEVLTSEPVVASGLPEPVADWLTLRISRPALTDRRYGGFIGARASQTYRISRVDRYVDCPFKYFAESVLDLPEEREEFSGLSPLERGTLVHSLFEKFYRAWSEQGLGTITAASLPRALEMFGQLTREALAPLSPADRALEDVRLLGSIVGRGMAERVFELEVNAGGEIANRLLEVDLQGPFVFPKLSGLDGRTVEIRGKADRVDIFADGTLRVVDYKLSRLPDVDTSIQVGAYAYAAQQMLEARDGRVHKVIEAMYLSFGDERQTVGPLADPGEQTTMAVHSRASEFADTIDRIESGEFPPKPRRTAECQWCRYAGVCRKEYLLEDDAAEPV